ncbi:CGNR zinc finger domain-containing protein [Arcobacteraceae bacterium]|nr:CGNR zinc finger domain-containing protein [Arcobacteraceae bacterium]
MKVNLIETKEKLKPELKEKYFKEILIFRELLRINLRQYLEIENSLDNIVKTTNNILIKNKVYPQIISNDNIYELQYISTEKEKNHLLVQIVIGVTKLLSSQEFKYLKKCDNHKCSLFFIDTSRNHSRRWCSMEICGNRSKVNNFAKRKKNLLN